MHNATSSYPGVVTLSSRYPCLLPARAPACQLTVLLGPSLSLPAVYGDASGKARATLRRPVGELRGKERQEEAQAQEHGAGDRGKRIDRIETRVEE